MYAAILAFEPSLNEMSILMFDLWTWRMIEKGYEHNHVAAWDYRNPYYRYVQFDTSMKSTKHTLPWCEV